MSVAVPQPGRGESTGLDHKNAHCINASAHDGWHGRSAEPSDLSELDEHYANAPLACLRSLLDSSYLGGASSGVAGLWYLRPEQE